jgi:hypothetical protein
VGRVVLSALVVLIILAAAVWSAPPSHLRDDLLPISRFAVGIFGIEQDWKTYSPFPRSDIFILEGRAEFADGKFQTWRVDARDRVIGTYEEYRWRKWVEHLFQDEKSEPILRGAAAYIARHLHHNGRPPVRVTLVKRTRHLNPPGQKGTEPWEASTLFTLNVTPEVLAGK